MAIKIELKQNLDNWFLSAQGLDVADGFIHHLAELKQFLQGRHLLQIGSAGKNIWLQHLNYRYKTILAPKNVGVSKNIITNIYSMPIRNESVDCVLMPLILEQIKYPYRLLKEIDNIITPGGFIIILSVNIFSLWGLYMKLRGNKILDSKPRLLSSFSVKKFLSSLSYMQYCHKSFYGIPPLKNKQTLEKMEFINEMGKMIWPFSAGFYTLIMQKTDLHINPTGLVADIG